MTRGNAYRDEHVYVCAVMCQTCIFHPGNPMHLNQGRLKEIVVGTLDNDSAIICHSTLDADNAVCRGFYERYVTTPLLLAGLLKRVRFV